jgi:predicted glutamine amidotransferase
MCRLLGIVASEPTEFRLVLREAPRSIAHLSREHRDGWGLAIHDREARAWRVDKGVECATECRRFHELAVGSRGEMLVAHIRKKTVGPTSVHNTHPFQRPAPAGREWVFAHNGTINELGWFKARTSAARMAEIRGETDSELLFAFLLTRLDEAAPEARDRALSSAVAEARARPDAGALNFLLSNGDVTYAHRFGRTLFLLERSPLDEVRMRRSSSDGTIVQTPWSQRRHAVFVASERMTDEPWEEIHEGALLRVDSGPMVSWRLLR